MTIAVARGAVATQGIAQSAQERTYQQWEQGGTRAGAAMQAVTIIGYMQPLEGWPCVGCGTATYAICHRAFPFVVIEFVVSESDKSVDTFGCTSIVLSICSSLLLSARNSRRQLEIDLCTAQTRNGIKIQNAARLSAQSTTTILRISSSDIALPRSSISLCCNGMFLPESPEGIMSHYHS